jgi:hypothetical protein
MRRAAACQYGIGGRRHCVGVPLRRVAKPCGEGVGEADQASKGTAGIDSRWTRGVDARREWRADHPKWVYALSAEA